MSTCVRDALKYLLRSGIAGVWGIWSPPRPHQFILLLGQGFLHPHVFTSTSPSDGYKVELTATSLPCPTVPVPPGCAAEGIEEASYMPPTLLPFKASVSNYWICPHPVTGYHPCTKHRLGHSQLNKGRCMRPMTYQGEWPGAIWSYKLHPY